MSRPLLYGHRGACIERPENTMPSFRRALEIGVDVLETDVHLTADGHVVVSHDPTGERMAGVKRPIERCTLREVQSWDAGACFVATDGTRPYAGRGLHLPRFEELLLTFPDARFNVDLKPNRPHIVEPMLALLRKHRAVERVTLASFHKRTMDAVRRAGFEGVTVLAQAEVIAYLATPPPLRPWWCELGRHLGRALQIPTGQGPINMSSRRFIEGAQACGLRVDYWTINSATDADVLLDRGADGVMTDDPAAILPAFQRYPHSATTG